jgi:hypothetical protein
LIEILVGRVLKIDRDMSHRDPVTGTQTVVFPPSWP